MADRSYTVNAPSNAEDQVVAVEVVDGSGLSVWGYGVPVLDAQQNPTGRVEWGWWEFQWLGEPDSTHDHYGWQTLAALQALNPTNDPAGIVVSWVDVQ